MLFASISTLVQCGFIIGTGLLLDTFLVRTITVPAIAVLVGQGELVAVTVTAALTASPRRTAG